MARAVVTSTHGAALWQYLMGGPRDIHQIVSDSGLNLTQARYGIQRLLAAGLISREGGQGHSDTTCRAL